MPRRRPESYHHLSRADWVCLALLVAFCLSQPGCAKISPRDEGKRDSVALPARYLVSYATPDDCTLWVYINDEPAFYCEGKESGVADVTQLVVAGTNSISVEMTRGAVDSFKYYVWLLTADPAPRSQEIVRYDLKEEAQITRKASHTEFACEVPVRWLWQDAEEVTQLSNADMDTIHGLLASMAQSVQNKDYEEVLSQQVRWLPDATEIRDSDKQAKALAQMLRNEKRLVEHVRSVELLAQADVAFVAGKRLVRVQPKEWRKYLLIGEVDESSGLNNNWALRSKYRYVTKLAGKWRLLGVSWAQ